MKVTILGPHITDPLPFTIDHISDPLPIPAPIPKPTEQPHHTAPPQRAIMLSGALSVRIPLEPDIALEIIHDTSLNEIQVHLIDEEQDECVWSGFLDPTMLP